MKNRVRVPQYMHMPMQLLWFDTEEITIIVVCYIFGVVFGGYAWLFLFIGPVFYIQVKRRKPRGFLVHQLYRFGFAHLKGYPEPQALQFYE